MALSSAFEQLSASQSQSLSLTCTDREDSIVNDDDDDDEEAMPMTDAEWEHWAPCAPSGEQIEDAHVLVVRRRKKVAALRSSAGAPQPRRQRATSIVRAFLLRRLRLRPGQQKLSHAQLALRFDDTAPWRSVHNRTCLGLHLRRFVGDTATQHALMPEVLADTAIALLADYRRALDDDNDDELIRLHVMIQPTFRAWVLHRIYQMYVHVSSLLFGFAFASHVSTHVCVSVCVCVCVCVSAALGP
jgi:hypothetical protein